MRGERKWAFFYGSAPLRPIGTNIVRTPTLMVNVLLLSIASQIDSSVALAAEVYVGAKATGGFGRFDNSGSAGGDSFVLGWTFASANQAVTLSATGSINVSNYLANNGPNGVDLAVSAPIVSQSTYTPLEQHLVEDGTLIIPRPQSDVMEHIGAVIGAFVPFSIADLAGFEPRDPSTVATGGVGIMADTLLLIGSGPFSFTAPEPGRLYLGVNDLYPANNIDISDNGFTVTIVPEPSSLVLAAFGISLLVSRWRRWTFRATQDSHQVSSGP